jgi:hypothetical protein
MPNDDPVWVNLSPQEIEELRNKKHELTEYGKEQLRKLMNNQEPYPDEMFEEAQRREAANKKALESLGIDYENFGQKPWDESMLESLGIEYGDFEGEDDVDYYAPNGDYVKSYPLINRVEVIGKNGREYVQYDCSNVQVSEQDEGRTLKVFLS